VLAKLTLFWGYDPNFSSKKFLNGGFLLSKRSNLPRKRTPEKDVQQVPSVTKKGLNATN
jgi:hypothetical protein